MIKSVKHVSLSALVFLGAMGVSNLSVASESWGDHGGHHGKSAGKGDMGKKKSWGSSPMGMESGHMTARLRKVWNLDLTAAQKKKIRAIQKELRATTWSHEDAIEEISDELFEQYKYPQRDAKAIGKIYGKIFDHRRQIIEAQIEAGNKVEGVLTKEQWKSIKSWGPKPKWGSGWGK